MMGRQDRDQRQLFYEFSLDEIIPADHLLRRINVFATAVLADLHEQLKAFYSDLGRPSVESGPSVSRWNRTPSVRALDRYDAHRILRFAHLRSMFERFPRTLGFLSNGKVHDCRHTPFPTANARATTGDKQVGPATQMTFLTVSDLEIRLVLLSQKAAFEGV